MELLLSQTNELFNALAQSAVSPNLFDTSTEHDKHQSGFFITYKPDDKYKFYVFGGNDGKYVVKYSPGYSTVEQVAPNTRWKDVVGACSRWAEYLNREISQEDMWDKVKAAVASTIGGSFEVNGKFSIREFEELNSRMIQLKSAVSKLPVFKEQAATINAKLDHILSHAKDLSKYDWQSMFIGGVWTLLVVMVLPQDINNEIWRLIKQFFNGLILLP